MERAHPTGPRGAPVQCTAEVYHVMPTQRGHAELGVDYERQRAELGARLKIWRQGEVKMCDCGSTYLMSDERDEWTKSQEEWGKWAVRWERVGGAVEGVRAFVGELSASGACGPTFYALARSNVCETREAALLDAAHTASERLVWTTELGRALLWCVVESGASDEVLEGHSAMFAHNIRVARKGEAEAQDPAEAEAVTLG